MIDWRASGALAFLHRLQRLESALNGSEPGYGAIAISCECCGLTQRIRDRDGAIPKICDSCNQHQGQLPDKRVARAEAHEAMLRERLDACRASERRAQAALTTAKQRVASALASRGALAARIVEAAESSRSHSCAAMQIANDAKVLDWARRDEQHQDDGGW